MEFPQFWKGGTNSFGPGASQELSQVQYFKRQIREKDKRIAD